MQHRALTLTYYYVHETTTMPRKKCDLALALRRPEARALHPSRANLISAAGRGRGASSSLASVRERERERETLPNQAATPTVDYQSWRAGGKVKQCYSTINKVDFSWFWAVRSTHQLDAAQLFFNSGWNMVWFNYFYQEGPGPGPACEPDTDRRFRDQWAAEWWWD
jgi:hypothetical protein